MNHGWCPKCQKTRTVRTQLERVRDTRTGQLRKADTTYCVSCGTMLSSTFLPATGTPPSP